MFCGNCGENIGDAKVCPKCGTPMEAGSNLGFCPNCFMECETTQVVCAKCGYDLMAGLDIIRNNAF